MYAVLLDCRVFLASMAVFNEISWVQIQLSSVSFSNFENSHCTSWVCKCQTLQTGNVKGNGDP